MPSRNKDTETHVYTDGSVYTISTLKPTEIFGHNLKGLYNDLSDNSKLFKDIPYE